MIGSETKKYDCAIWGGYAMGNTGDELCLSAALRRMTRSSGRVAVLSPNPEYTAWLFPGVDVVPFVPAGRRKIKHWKKWGQRWRALLSLASPGQLAPAPGFDPDSEWARCLFSARQLYLAGGGYLTDLFPLDRILPPLELARRLKLPVATAPLGLGPFKSKAAADRVADALRGTELKLRDAASLAFCDAHGLVAVVEPDDAFSQVRKISVRTKKNPAGSGRPKIGVCIFPQHGQDAKTDLSAWWVQLLRGLQTQYPEYEVEGFCFHTGLQFEFCEMVRLFQNSGLVPDQVRSPALDFRRATLAIREYTFIIATRFHAIVAANVFEIPNVAIATGDYYLSKMKAAVCGHENLSQLVNPACVTPEAVLAICHCKLRNHPAPAP